MYKIKIDITDISLLTMTLDGENRWSDIQEARRTAQKMREWLFDFRADGKIRDYKVDVVPAND